MSDVEEGIRAGLVLASASPRRLQLLRSVGLEPRVVPADVDETPRPGEKSDELVERLARAKADQVARRAPDDAGGRADRPAGGPLVVAADTVVDVEGSILGKPGSVEEAAEMLRTLAGRPHVVATGVAIAQRSAAPSIDGEPIVRSTVERATVWFRDLDDEDVAWYVGSGEPMDKAGGYAIQGLGSLLVERIEGSYHTVVGLPLAALDGLARSFGRRLREYVAS